MLRIGFWHHGLHVPAISSQNPYSGTRVHTPAAERTPLTQALQCWCLSVALELAEATPCAAPQHRKRKTRTQVWPMGRKCFSYCLHMQLMAPGRPGPQV